MDSRSTLAALTLLGLLLAPACHSLPPGEATDGGDTTDTSETGQVDVPDATTDADEDADAASDQDAEDATVKPGEDATADGGDTGGPVCAVDFPCGLPEACDPDDPSVAWKFETIPCEEVCDTARCTGATCERREVGCGDSEVCVGEGDRVSTVRAECTPTSHACGGPDDQSCGSGEWCKYGGAVADRSMFGNPREAIVGCHPGDDVYGRCVEMPESCDAADDPVCGCDGTTYANDCKRKQAGVGLDHEGACSQ